MSLETMSFILGGILIGASLFGGGLEIKELKVPKIGSSSRVLCAIVGFVFVGLAIVLNTKELREDITKKPTTAFQQPMLGDSRLDACILWGQECGEPAATAWCKTKGMSRAIESPVEVVGDRGIATRLIGTNQICREKFCSSFTYIVCEE